MVVGLLDGAFVGTSFISSILGFFGFEIGIVVGLVIGYYLFIYFQHTDVKLKDFGLSKVGLINSTDNLSGPDVSSSGLLEDDDDELPAEQRAQKRELLIPNPVQRLGATGAGEGDEFGSMVEFGPTLDVKYSFSNFSFKELQFKVLSLDKNLNPQTKAL
ncbi:putative serine/threonine protein kinase IRE isoform X1 [Canna indica]|uniref:Serine/threonine protein kinase IRE isoform X1 n=1 Tax=Canna indica TaxID=4628 RepID=A0AAQ3KIL5_9LILI|nr:putative serine/threonine protein kinase IRE isoform X1 [Canna indica]